MKNCKYVKSAVFLEKHGELEKSLAFSVDGEPMEFSIYSQPADLLHCLWHQVQPQRALYQPHLLHGESPGILHNIGFSPKHRGSPTLFKCYRVLHTMCASLATCWHLCLNNVDQCCINVSDLLMSVHQHLFNFEWILIKFERICI